MTKLESKGGPASRRTSLAAGRSCKRGDAHGKGFDHLHQRLNALDAAEQQENQDDDKHKSYSS
jgi:hypothetical protein